MTTSLRARTGEKEREASELRQQVRGLRDELRRAQGLAAVGTMTAMIVHEFNNILTTTLGRAQLALDGDEASREKAIRAAIDDCTRATTICEALLDLAAGDTRATLTVPLAQLVEQTLDAMARHPKKDGIILVQQVPVDLEITTRPVELKQVLLNLLLNARAAVLAKGRGLSISISAIRRDGEAVIRVADTGAGIPPENLERIFEPFFTTKDGAGTGLGLTFCKQIVESLGGTIAVRSQFGEGAVFTVILPGGRHRAAKTRKGR